MNLLIAYARATGILLAAFAATACATTPPDCSALRKQHDSTRQYGKRVYAAESEGTAHRLTLKPAAEPLRLDVTYEQANAGKSCKKIVRLVVEEEQGICEKQPSGKYLYESNLDWPEDDQGVAFALHNYTAQVGTEGYSLSADKGSDVAIFSAYNDKDGSDLTWCDLANVTLKRVRSVKGK